MRLTPKPFTAKAAGVPRRCFVAYSSARTCRVRVDIASARRRPAPAPAEVPCQARRSAEDVYERSEPDRR